MPLSNYKSYVDGVWTESGERVQLRSPFSNDPVATVHLASSEILERAIVAASSSVLAFRKNSRYMRSRVLSFMAQEIEKHRADFIKKMIDEAGKPYLLADVEVNRAVQTFTIAAEEAKKYGGDIIPIDVDASGREYAPAISYLVSRGAVLAITPFNFPLNLVAHKVAPALAVGAPILLKPSPQAPGCSYLLAEIFNKAINQAKDSREEVSPKCFQVLSCQNEVLSKAISDKRLSILSFTGSGKVGWQLQAQAVGKKVALELGGNAAVIVHSDADLARAAKKCVAGGFGYAGQSCISVQRIFVQDEVAKAFTELVLKETALVKSGDPNIKEVSVGPVIDEKAAARIMTWIEEAKKDGAKVLTGGTKNQNLIAPTVMIDVKHMSKVSCEEVFAPVIIIEKYRTFDDAVKLINESKFGLQAGVFTRDQSLIHRALNELEVGGVVANDAPTYRADNMPYGGVKESGLGREGVRFAMEEFSERRTLISWIG